MKKNIGLIILNFAAAIYLFAVGITGFSEKKVGNISENNNEIRQAVNALFKGDGADIIIVVFSILAVAAGVFIILKFFNIKIPKSELILVVLAIFWIAFIVLIDIIQPLDSSKKVNFITWLSGFGVHLMALGAIALATDRFGGKK